MIFDQPEHNTFFKLTDKKDGMTWFKSYYSESERESKEILENLVSNFGKVATIEQITEEDFNKLLIAKP